MLQTEDDTAIYVVGVSRDVDEEEIRGVSSAPQLENVSYWLIPEFSGLLDNRTINSILTQICGQEDVKSQLYGTA